MDPITCIPECDVSALPSDGPGACRWNHIGKGENGAFDSTQV